MAIPTFGDAVEQWLTYLEVEKRRKRSTVQDARNVTRAYLLPRFGVETPLHRGEQVQDARAGGRPGRIGPVREVLPRPGTAFHLQMAGHPINICLDRQCLITWGDGRVLLRMYR